jgi:hypothetical protein
MSTSAIVGVLEPTDITNLIESALVAPDHEREKILCSILEHCYGAHSSPIVRDALRWGYWYWLAQVELGHMSRGQFRIRAVAVCKRFALDPSREFSEEDMKICRLVLANLYTEERDPLVREHR